MSARQLDYDRPVGLSKWGEHRSRPRATSALVVHRTVERRVISSGEPMQKAMHCRRQGRAAAWTALFPSSDAVADHALKNQHKAA
jgi:hypothetical protein